MQFKYNFSNANGDKIPLLDIQIRNKDNEATVGYKAMLDSGAFMSVFHSEMAEVLGINLEKITRQVGFQGVGDKTGVLTGKIYVVEVILFQKGKIHRFDSPVLFSSNIHPDSMPLLGRQGFFDRFYEVRFNYKADKFYLQK
jgi:hypothetical protein